MKNDFPDHLSNYEIGDLMQSNGSLEIGDLLDTDLHYNPYFDRIPGFKNRSSRGNKLLKLLDRFSAYLGIEIAQSNYTPEQLANELEIPVNVVQSYLNGEYLPTKQVAKRIFNLFDSKYKELKDILD